MRLRGALLAFVILTLLSFGAWTTARHGVALFEQQTSQQIETALEKAGLDWAAVSTDGLRVIVTGEAPDETSRLRAVEAVRKLVSSRRIQDQTGTEEQDQLAAPDFSLELLRNDEDVSLIGLVPETGTPDRIRSALSAGGLDGYVTDMLETSGHDAPDGWDESLSFGLNALQSMNRAKISVQPGRVNVIAVADSDAARSELEQRLTATVPEGIDLELHVSSPRPVIAPFRIAFHLEGETARLKECSAENEAAADEILNAARNAGLAADDGTCRIGLGSPSPDWSMAAARGISTVADIGGGDFEITDTSAVLTGPEGVDPDILLAAGQWLQDSLPDGFSLKTIWPPRMEEKAGEGSVYAPIFTAVRDVSGQVQVSGSVSDEASRKAVESFAIAKFGHDHVISNAVIDTNLPDGWPGRVLAGIEALSVVEHGAVTITPDQLTLQGAGQSEDTGDNIREFLSGRLDHFLVEVSFDAEAAALANRTLPEICAEDISAILDAGSIGFRAGSSQIEPESAGIIAAAADVLRSCPGARFEISGHTDSQGREEVNLRLSRERSEAVMAALEAEELPLILFTARGYGAEFPIADNDTIAGRQANRRIEINLQSESQFAQAEANTAGIEESEGLSPEDCAAEIAALLEADSIRFEAGSSSIAPESDDVITDIADVLANCPGNTFEIGGFTDNIGPVGVNQRISQQRADEVLERLDAAGTDGVDMVAKGYGPEQPIADNGTSDGRSRNRRIEITLVKAAVPAEEEDETTAFSPQPQAETCAEAVNGILKERAIGFSLGSATINADGTETIAQLAETFAGCPANSRFEISGHTDDRGPDESNQRLSERRALAVQEMLEAGSLPDLEFSSVGYGETRPVADNDTSEGRIRNRRIEITLLSAPAPEQDQPEGQKDAVGETGDEPETQSGDASAEETGQDELSENAETTNDPQ